MHHCTVSARDGSSESRLASSSSTIDVGTRCKKPADSLLILALDSVDERRDGHGRLPARSGLCREDRFNCLAVPAGRRGVQHSARIAAAVLRFRPGFEQQLYYLAVACLGCFVDGSIALTPRTEQIYLLSIRFRSSFK